jgi:hypothetical protein
MAKPADVGIVGPGWDAPEEEWKDTVTKLVEFANSDPDYGDTHVCGKSGKFRPGGSLATTPITDDPDYGCGKRVVFAYTPFGKAFCEGHIYSDEGREEFTRISGLCEYCFDKLMDETIDSLHEGE